MQKEDRKKLFPGPGKLVDIHDDLAACEDDDALKEKLRSKLSLEFRLCTWRFTWYVEVLRMKLGDIPYGRAAIQAAILGTAHVEPQNGVHKPLQMLATTRLVVFGPGLAKPNY